MLKMIWVSALMLACASTASATITYNVDQSVGLGSVTGTIETNGAIGNITQSDIIAFNLLLTAPGASIGLTQADSVIVTQGNNLSATLDELLFDYSGLSGFLLFQFDHFGTGMKYYCNSSVADTCFQGASLIPDSFNSISAQIEPRTGTQVIASTRSASSAVPEPATWAMMVIGFGTLATAMRRRKMAVSFS